MKKHLLLSLIAFSIVFSVKAQNGEIIHDAEQNILLEQYGAQWAKQDEDIDAKLKALEKKFGKKPNIIHIMWDDNSFGEVGIEAFNKIRGLQEC